MRGIKMLPRQLTKRGESEDGSATVELALIFTFLSVMIGLIIQGGVLFNGWLTVTNATREAVRRAAPCYERPAPAPNCNDPALVQTWLRQAARGVDQSKLTPIVVTPSTVNGVRYLSIRATYSVPVIAPFLGVILPNPMALPAEATVRLENQPS
jgi:Flp pilus assembly pilin Flp